MSAPRNGAPEIQMVISDFGGVLTTPLADAFRSVQESAEIPIAAFAEVMKGFYGTDENPLFALERGQIPESEFSARFEDALEPLLGRRPSMATFGLQLFQALKPNQEMIESIRRVRDRGIRTALLTNNVREWESTWRSMLPVDELFETVVDSAFVGMRKPDPEIYHLTLERVGLPASACVFIDDMEVNCAAAADIGLHAIRFRDTAQVQAELLDLLGDRPA